MTYRGSGDFKCPVPHHWLVRELHLSAHHTEWVTHIQPLLDTAPFRVLHIYRGQPRAYWCLLWPVWGTWGGLVAWGHQNLKERGPPHLTRATKTANYVTLLKIHTAFMSWIIEVVRFGICGPVATTAWWLISQLQIQQCAGHEMPLICWITFLFSSILLKYLNWSCAYVSWVKIIRKKHRKGGVKMKALKRHLRNNSFKEVCWLIITGMKDSWVTVSTTYWKLCS